MRAVTGRGFSTERRISSSQRSLLSRSQSATLNSLDNLIRRPVQRQLLQRSQASPPLAPKPGAPYRHAPCAARKPSRSENRAPSNESSRAAPHLCRQSIAPAARRLYSDPSRCPNQHLDERFRWNRSTQRRIRSNQNPERASRIIPHLIVRIASGSHQRLHLLRRLPRITQRIAGHRRCSTAEDEPST